MTHKEFTKWVAFLNMEDWRVSRTEFYLARLCYITLKANGDKKTKWDEMFLDDPYNPKKKEAPGLQELWTKMEAWRAMHNGAEKRNRDKEKAK